MDLERFPWPPTRDQTLAETLGLRDKRVLVWACTLGTWYLPDDLLRFFQWVHQRDPRFHLLILNQGEHDFIQARARSVGVDLAHVTLLATPPTAVPQYLAVAEAGLCFVKPCFSKQASSPIKLGEYLAAGLPVIATTGVGDVDALLLDNQVGVTLPSLDADGFARAWQALEHLRQDESLPMRCRRVAEQELSLERGVADYTALYLQTTAVPRPSLTTR